LEAQLTLILQLTQDLVLLYLFQKLVAKVDLVQAETVEVSLILVVVAVV
jgi:hypothetical protein